MPTKEETILSQSKNDFYIMVEGWMIKDLDLDSTSILIFAAVYGFCKKHERYLGGYSYLMNQFGFSKMTIYRSFQKLTSRGLIVEHKEARRKVYTIGTSVIPVNRYQSDTSTGTSVIPNRYQSDTSKGTRVVPKNTNRNNSRNKCGNKGNTHAREASVIAEEILKAMEAP